MLNKIYIVNPYILKFYYSNLTKPQFSSTSDLKCAYICSEFQNMTWNGTDELEFWVRFSDRILLLSLMLREHCGVPQAPVKKDFWRPWWILRTVGPLNGERPPLFYCFNLDHFLSDLPIHISNPVQINLWPRTTLLLKPLLAVLLHFESGLEEVSLLSVLTVQTPPAVQYWLYKHHLLFSTDHTYTTCCSVLTVQTAHALQYWLYKHHLLFSIDCTNTTCCSVLTVQTPPVVQYWLYIQHLLHCTATGLD